MIEHSSSKMVENRLTLSTGIQWLKEAFGVLSAAPIANLGILGIYLFLLLIVNIPAEYIGLPFLGIILGSMVTPFNAVAFASCGRMLLNKQRPTAFSCFAFGWKPKKTRVKLLILGLIYGVSILIIGKIVGFLSEGAVSNWKAVDGVYDAQSVIQNIPWAGMFVGFILYVMLLGITCFSPMLIAWKGQSIGKAIFFSLIVFFRNLAPIVVLAILLSFAASGGSLVIGTLGDVGAALLAIWGIFISCLAYCCLWPMWKSIFGASQSTSAEDLS